VKIKPGYFRNPNAAAAAIVGFALLTIVMVPVIISSLGSVAAPPGTAHQATTDPVSTAEDTLPPAVFTSDDPHKQYMHQAAASDGWNSEELRLLDRCLTDPRASFLPGILEKNATHVETPALYHPQVTPEAISVSYAFYIANRSLIDSVALPYSVPGTLIVAILKIETNFGTFIGKQTVFDVLWTLGTGDDKDVRQEFKLNDPDQSKRLTRRARWAREQLREFVSLTDSNRLDPLAIKGSWAGAFGLPQFIPVSYRLYGRDGNGDGIVDLFVLPDAVASIACFLDSNGWDSNASYKRRRRVIMTYNYSIPYAEAILTLADSLSKRL